MSSPSEAGVGSAHVHPIGAEMQWLRPFMPVVKSTQVLLLTADFSELSVPRKCVTTLAETAYLASSADSAVH